MTTWIKFSERHPEKGDFYLFFCNGGPPFVGFCKPTGMRIYIRGYDGMTTQLWFIPEYWAEIAPPDGEAFYKEEG